MKNTNKEKTTVFSVNAIILFLCLSLSTNLISTGISQKVFYISSYISFFLVVFSTSLFRGEGRKNLTVFIPVTCLVFLGAIRLAWALYVNTSPSLKDFNSIELSNIGNYMLSGKRIILGAIVFLALFLHRDKTSYHVLKICRLLIIASIIITVFLGVKEHYFITHDRIKLTAAAASTSSYMILFLFCGYLSLSKLFSSSGSFIMDGIVICLIAFLLYLCDTRVSFLAFSFLIAFYFFTHRALKSRIGLKKIITISLFSLVAIFALSAPRWIEGIKNIQTYSQNSSTSLGARVAIWESGLWFLNHSTGFSTPKERTDSARGFISKYHSDNKEAYNNVIYNMHNEFLEVSTLQGMVGFFSLLMVYLSLIFFVKRNRETVFIAASASTLFICGLTDSVMISSQTTMFFLISLSLALLSERDNTSSVELTE